MGYYIRLFTPSLLGSLIPLQAQMLQKGYRVQPVGTNQLDIVYHQDRSPITADLTDSSNETTQQEIEQFLESVTQLSGEPAQNRVLDVLTRTQAIVAIGVPDDYDASTQALDDILDIVANAAEGLFQVDGEGFYDGNELILPHD